MLSVSITPGNAARIDGFLKRHVDDGRTPALMAGLTSADEELYFGAYGPRRVGEGASGSDPVNSNTLLQLFSMTKLVTAVAIMQQVEKGVLSLDDPEVVEKYLPELGKLPICKGYDDETGEAILEEPSTKITIRMLLNHTSGLCYEFTASWLTRWREENNIGNHFGANSGLDTYIYPLHHEPGTKWTYGIGLDWAGFLLERLLGKDLETVFHENIFEPCGIRSMTFYPPGPEQEDELLGLAVRDEQGKLHVAESHPLGRTLVPDQVKTFSGGGGLFGTARDYLRFLRHLLASSESGKGGLLSPESFKLLFTSSIPRTPEVRTTLASFARSQHQYDPKFVADSEAEHITHGLALIVNTTESTFGRKAGSGSWDGLAKTLFWIDPSSGIAGVFCTNAVVHNPDPILKAYNDYERLIYDSLQASSAS